MVSSRVPVAVTRRTDDAGTISFDASGFSTVRLCRHCGALIAGGPTACAHCTRIYPGDAAEPSAKVKCPTCRCMIVPGSQCACCESTSGEYPPLPDTDIDDAEPSASGEGIARADHLCITVSYGAGSYTWTAHNEGEARTIEAAINAAHAHATRELRERCERAERVVAAAVDVVAAWRMPGTPLTAVCVALSNALDAIEDALEGSK